MEIFRVFTRVLQGNIPRHPLILPLDRNHVGVNGIAGSVEPLHEFENPSLVEKVFRLSAGNIGKANPHARVQKRQLLKPARKYIPRKLGRREDLRVGLERCLGARATGCADLSHRPSGLASLVFLLPDMPVARNLYLAPFRQEIHDRHAHAVEAAGGLVGPFLKLATKLEHRHHSLERGDVAVHFFGELRMPFHRNTSAVVFDRHAAVHIHRHAHSLGIASHAFIDRVVDDFVDKMVQAAGCIVADVHAKTLPHMLPIREVLEVF